MDIPETAAEEQKQDDRRSDRPWVTPIFQRIELKDALSGGPFPINDGAYSYSPHSYS